MTREPQHITKTDWYYEYPTHLYIVHEVRDKEGKHIRTDGIKLYWRMIEKSRKRREPKP